MLTIGIAFAIAGFYALMCLGWGTLFRRATRLGRRHALTDMALGIAALTVVGGVLNAAGAATARGIGIVAIAGVIVAAVRIWNMTQSADERSILIWLRSSGLAILVIVIAMTFVAATQVPPTALNIDDDLQKYLAHIARMLQTGTLYGSPLNALGTESPGGQPFLQSFIAAVAPFPYVNAFDALFCFGLCMALAADLVGRIPRFAVIAALAAAAVAVIEPQYVNISALYAGSALMLAMYMLLASPEEIGASSVLPRAFAVGIIAAAMIVLKPTLIMMAVIMLGAGALSSAVCSKSARLTLKWSAAAIAGLVLGVLPWIALYAPYLDDMSGISAQGSVAAQSNAAPISLFSNAPLTWGASGLAFTLALVFPAVAAALAIARWRDTGDLGRESAVVLAASAALTLAAYIAVVSLLGPYFANYDTALRYVIPTIIAVVPASIALGARLVLQHHRPGTPVAAYAAAAAAALALMVPALAERIAQAREFGHILAFRYSSVTEPYRAVHARLTAPAQAELITRLQSAIPPGAATLAIVSTPFRFDFFRNPIYDVTFAGIHAPWAHIPPVEYVIWDYGSERSPLPNLVPSEPGQGSPRAFGLVKLLADATKSGANSNVIYDDGKVAMFAVRGLPKTWANFP